MAGSALMRPISVDDWYVGLTTPWAATPEGDEPDGGGVGAGSQPGETASVEAVAEAACATRQGPAPPSTALLRPILWEAWFADLTAGRDAGAPVPGASPARPGSPAGGTQSLSPRQRQRAAAKATKEALCVQAEVVALSWSGQKARPEIARLAELWKQAGRANKADDKALWVRFCTARELLFTRLDLERSQRQAAESQAHETKQSLCETAERLAERADIRQAGETMKSLVAQWKQAGRAGRDDEALWRRFKAAQDQLYDRIRQERKSSEATQREVAATKRAIIDDVTALIGSPDLNQARAELRRLSDAFHAAGYAGRDVNRRVAQEFREAQNAFQAWARQEPGRRRETGQQGRYGRRARLVQQADRLRRDVARAEAELALVPPDPTARRSHGSGVTLNLTATGASTTLAAELMRLRIRLADTEQEIDRLDRTLS